MALTVAGADNAVTLRVASRSSAQSLAAAISHAIYDGKEVTLRCIGAGPINQAVKAIAIARGYVAVRSLDLAVIPGFVTVQMKEGPVSAIILRVITL